LKGSSVAASAVMLKGEVVPSQDIVRRSSADSSPYETHALQALCVAVMSLGSVFPGTDLRMSFSALPAGRHPPS
jgi:hypothetical protein